MTSTHSERRTGERAPVDRFLAHHRIAIAGVSRSGGGFGNAVLKELLTKGYDVRIVHPAGGEIAGMRCSPTLDALAGEVDAVVCVTPPEATEQLVRQAAAAGIRHVWLQPGAESAAAIQYCTEAGLDLVHGLCILMYVEPARLPHRVHRFIGRLLHTAP